MNKGFIKGTTFITEFDDVKSMFESDGETVEVTLSNNVKFVCGSEQQIMTANGKWVEAQNLLDEYIDSYIQVVEVKDAGVQHLYDITVYNEEHKFKVRIENVELTVHNWMHSLSASLKRLSSLTTSGGSSTKSPVVSNATVSVVKDTTIYIPATDITFTVSRMKPNTKLYAFFDGKDVTSYIQPSGSTLGASLITDEYGYASGVFKLPNSDSIKFVSGERQFVLTDSIYNGSDYTTKASTTYTYTGTNTSDTISLDSTITADENYTVDPIVQTFYCNQTGGMYISRIGLFFYNKDNSEPIIFQLREISNDRVTSNVIAGTNTVILSNNITTSTDPLETTPTWVTFNNPVYLTEGKEYAIYMVTNSANYILHSVEYGVQTNSVTATKDISSGSFMKYTGVNNWVRDNANGIKYIVQKCKFDTTTGYTLTLGNKSLGTKVLKNNSLYVDADNDVITVTDDTHSFNVGSFVTISGVASGSYGNIPSTSINGVHKITAVTWNTYSFDNYYSGDVETAIDFSTATNYIFGTGVTTDYDYQYDDLVWNPNYTLLTGTTLQYQFKGLSGQSLNGSEQPYSMDSSYSYIEPKDIYICSHVSKIASTLNASKFSVDKSVKMIATLNTTNENVSPMIDKSNVNLILVENLINDDSSYETFESQSKSCAKMIWKTVSLYEQAIGLKVSFNASVQASSDVKVYYRVLNVGESGDINSKAWVQMSLSKDVSKSVDENDFQTYEYLADNLTPFRSFKTKIVMTSDDSTKVPLIKKYSAIAFAK